MSVLLRLFPVWALLLAVWAFFLPSTFVDLRGYIVPLLTIIMLSMGLTLSLDDFKFVLKQKSAILLGLVLQFSVMPILALVIAKMLGLAPEVLVGVVLVGAVAGGTASNVMTFLAKGNVALSIAMTAISTLVGVLLTPLLIQLLVGQTVEVNVIAMLMSLVKIVLLPVLIGVALNTLLGGVIKSIDSIFPLISMVAIVLIIAIVVALNANNIATVGLIVAIAVILHNSLGLILGYGLARLFGFNEQVARTVSIEVGMQNSGLAVALANQFFTPLSALPGALFSVWHNISGSILAGYWSAKSLDADRDNH